MSNKCHDANLTIDVYAAQGKSARSRLPDIVRSDYSNTGSTLVGNMVGAIIIVWLFYDQAPQAIVAVWAAMFLLNWFARFWTRSAFLRATPVHAEEFQWWRRIWYAGTIISGCLWGAAAGLFYGYGDNLSRVILILTVYSYCIASIPLLANHFRVFLAFAASAFLPLIGIIFLKESAHGFELAAIMILIFAMTIMMGRSFSVTFTELVELKIGSELLSDRLKVEKADAEAARYAAEVANRSKTQFFAAASHDLRQPLHAVGLFAEALRNKSRDEEVIQLVNSINSSVDALEGLFSELLDIAKIDTGAVEVAPQHFIMKELFSRVRLHHEPAAFEKGLMLKFRGDHHVAYADRVLVERILRNLVSNAIRYTEDGGILVACRPRGDRLLLQVWDSGIGIIPAEQARVFEEFYQVHPDQPIPAHQRKGLGLGLSIVRRLADLMQAPLELRSNPGRGTVFTLTLPMGKQQRVAPERMTSVPLGLTLDRKFVVVIEDEPAVRDGLEVVLKGWGATVAAFDSVEGCRHWAQQASEQGLQPDLAIVDYRLDHATTGIDALLVLRERFGTQLPAIVVTGSTTVSLEDEAHRHNFHLLIKPVVPNKLRAMIAFKLGMRSR